MPDPTPSSLALSLHTDLANIKTYSETSPAVTRALIDEADAKVRLIQFYLTEMLAKVAAPDQFSQQYSIGLNGNRDDGRPEAVS